MASIVGCASESGQGRKVKVKFTGVNDQILLNYRLKSCCNIQ